MAVTTQIAISIQCDQQARLRQQLAQAIRSLVKAQLSYHTAWMAGHSQMAGFEDNLNAAAAKWKLAQEAYSAHGQAHGCLHRYLD